jgi:hypothetical protein
MRMSPLSRKVVLAALLALASSLAAAQSAPSAAALLRFYPTRLASTPMGMGEDREVWLAKVQGLLASAPPLLQQSLLLSQTSQEFAANVALLQQMQEAAAQRSVSRIQGQLNSGTATKPLPAASPSTGATPQQ